MMSWRELLPTRSTKGSYQSESYPLAALQREMNRVLEDFVSDWPSPMLTNGHVTEFVPRVNVEDTPEQYIVTCEIPGVDAKDLDIEIFDEGIKIAGEKRSQEEKREGSRMTRYEASYGKFERFIPLGIETNPDKVDASLKAGQLKIALPKAVHTKASRKINVRVN